MAVEGGAETAADAPRAVAGDSDLVLDPVTRVSGAGALALAVQLGDDGEAVREAQSRVRLYRGYETVLEGRDPRDAVDLSSRVCGFSGAAHSLASSMALEMALPVEPPPMGVWARNVGHAAGAIFAQAGHLFLLAGPDYSREALSRTHPDLVEHAAETPSGHGGLHGYETVGDIMAGLDPPDGELYLLALEKSREAREIASLTLGKYPHPSTAAPGGLTTTLTRTGLTQVFSRLRDLVFHAKTFPLLWDDLLDFLLANMEGYRDVGRGPANLLTVGAWDDPAVYDARYEAMEDWGRARLSTPGVIVDGDLETTSLPALDAGLAEHVDRSFYGDWTDGVPRYGETPTGDPIGPRHPWNKRTLERPGEARWDGPYSWATAPRWEGAPMETGALARLWSTSAAEALDDPHIRPTGDGLELTLPEADLPELTLEWRIPDQVNAAERLRARAYGIAHAGLACYVSLVGALDAMKTGGLDVHAPFETPSKGRHRGVGFWEDARGALAHHVVVEEGSLEGHQVLAPSTWNASPRGPEGRPGPMEGAVASTPLADGAGDRTADLVRAARSFDPCMVCASQ